MDLSSYKRKKRIFIGYSHVFGVMLSNEINRNAVRPNRKWQIRDGGLQTGSTHISADRYNRNTLSKAVFMFLRSSYPIGQSITLHDLAGSGLSKIAASKTELWISRLVNMISADIQRLYLCFWGQATRGG